MHIYVSIQLVSVLVLYCMLKGSYWGPDWRIETDKSRAMPVLFHSYIQLHTHITAAGQQACPCYYWWWMCVISSIPLMHQEALTCLCQTWLATGFMGFIWLWSADEALFVCVCERVSTHLISRTRSPLLIPVYCEPADAHVIKISSDASRNHCRLLINSFPRMKFYLKRLYLNTIPTGGWGCVDCLGWFEYICMKKN